MAADKDDTATFPLFIECLRPVASFECGKDKRIQSSEICCLTFGLFYDSVVQEVAEHKTEILPNFI